MYTTYYGFKEKPFSLLPDPDCVYLSSQHQTALDLLTYSIENPSGFCVLTGDVGAGKTTLIRRLLAGIDDNVTVGLLRNIGNDYKELLSWVLMAFELDYAGKSKVELHQTLIEFVIDEYAKGRTTVLIVDEAQHLNVEALEELRMLSNVNADKDQVLQIILVGQEELRTTLRDPDLNQFVQRITSDYHLGTLDREQTREYIHFRIATAGSRPGLFEDDACDAVFEFSEGVPRRINLLCDTALVYGFAEGNRTITLAQVDEIVRDRATGKLLPAFRWLAATGVNREAKLKSAGTNKPAETYTPERRKDWPPSASEPDVAQAQSEPETEELEALSAAASAGGGSVHTLGQQTDKQAKPAPPAQSVQAFQDTRPGDAPTKPESIHQGLGTLHSERAGTQRHASATRANPTSGDQSEKRTEAESATMDIVPPATETKERESVKPPVDTQAHHVEPAAIATPKPIDDITEELARVAGPRETTGNRKGLYGLAAAVAIATIGGLVYLLGSGTDEVSDPSELVADQAATPSQPVARESAAVAETAKPPADEAEAVRIAAEQQAAAQAEAARIAAEQQAAAEAEAARIAAEQRAAAEAEAARIAAEQRATAEAEAARIAAEQQAAAEAEAARIAAEQRAAAEAEAARIAAEQQAAAEAEAARIAAEQQAAAEAEAARIAAEQRAAAEAEAARIAAEQRAAAEAARIAAEQRAAAEAEAARIAAEQRAAAEARAARIAAEQRAAAEAEAARIAAEQRAAAEAARIAAEQQAAAEAEAARIAAEQRAAAEAEAARIAAEQQAATEAGAIATTAPAEIRFRPANTTPLSAAQVPNSVVGTTEGAAEDAPKSFSNNPCTGASARFLSTCKN